MAARQDTEGFHEVKGKKRFVSEKTRIQNSFSFLLLCIFVTKTTSAEIGASIFFLYICK